MVPASASAIPDSVLDEADEIELVDLPDLPVDLPVDELLQRLEEGKMYVAVAGSLKKARLLRR